jgi:hypothetical protein
MRASILLSIFALTFLQKGDSKFDRICHKWRMVGMGVADGKYIPARVPEEELLTFGKDGNYEEILYGKMKIVGKWKFAEDSVKLGFAVTSINGATMPGMTLDESKPTDSLVKLTADTLIYAEISYAGPKMEYQHNDKYFVRN